MMREMLCGVVCALLMVTGCAAQSSGPTPAQKRAQAHRKAQERAAAARAETAARKRAHQSAIYKECHTVAGALDTKLIDLNSRLSVGMPFAQYTPTSWGLRGCHTTSSSATRRPAAGSATRASIAWVFLLSPH